MTSAQIEIQLIASLVAIACAIPGTFLVLRKMALISDAISHSILLGFVIGFFITKDIESPFLIIFGALTGVLTVVLVEYLQKTKLVKEDTAIGLIFPVLFSIGVILVTQKAGNIHLDIDAVLLGELAYAPADRIFINGYDCGPKALWVIGIILSISLTLLISFFKELKLSTFDVGLASSLGFTPILIHYALMTVSSVTIVGSFDAVGAILVIALMIAPAATAYLLTSDLKNMIILAILFGVFASSSGYWLAKMLNSSISGAMTTMLGVIFLLVYLFAPNKGLISVIYRNRTQAKEVLLLSLLSNLKNQTIKKLTIDYIQQTIKWEKTKLIKVINLGKELKLIQEDNSYLSITNKGLDVIDQTTSYIISNDLKDLENIDVDLSILKN